MKNLTWQNPEQLFVAQVLINKVKSKCCGIKDTMKLSIDLGGTNIRIAQVEKGNCLNKVSVPCLAQQDASTVLNQLSQLIRNMMNEQVDGIGIGVPSIVDPEKGIVYNVANISSWKEIHLKEILENEFKVAVAINNDSNCFTF